MGDDLTAGERLFAPFGLIGSDPYLPALRAAVTFALISGAVYVAQPESMFLPDYKPRPWSFWRNEYRVSTDCPWWIPGFAGALLVILFV